MKVVGVRELKARLSEYLRDVRRGEVFLVTDRNHVVAELRPPGTAALEASDQLERAFQELARSGEVQLPRLSKSDWVWRPAGAALDAGSADTLLNRLRQERGT